jgi:hypothetical protein
VKPPAWLWIGLGLVVAGVVAMIMVAASTHAPLDTERINNVRQLTNLITERAARTGSWPPLSGKRFVLSVVAYGDWKVEQAEHAQLFFSGYRKTDELPDPAVYAGITPEALVTMRVAGLTSYAGRRNTDDRYRLPAGEETDEPILADLSVPDVAIVGFASGRAQALDREELGLGPSDPIVTGVGSKSHLLRGLSDE